jgi:glutaredoxin
MNAKLTLYTRKDCCLCDEMKDVVRRVSRKIPIDLDEIDVDGLPELRDEFGNEVPLLFIDGRKAFKYRVTEKALANRLKKNGWARFLLSSVGRREAKLR